MSGDRTALIPTDGYASGAAETTGPNWSGAQSPAPVDDDIVSTARAMLRSGVYSPAEVARMYSLTPAELAAAQRPPQRQQQVTQRTVEKQLAEIDKYRRDNRAAYGKDYRLQAQERRLIEQLQSIKADAGTEQVEASADGEIDALSAGIPETVVAEWRRTGGEKHHFGVARRTVQKVWDALEPAEADALAAGFDQLPSGARSSIYGFISVEPARWRKATDDEVAFYRDREDTAPLVQEWGSRAAEQIGVILGRTRMMLGRMSPADRARTNSWVDSLSPTQFRAVARALAR
jgi:hypothetical protein